MANGVTLKARNRVCLGCGGVGGRHVLLHCAYLKDAIDRANREAAARAARKEARRKGGSA